VGRPRRRQACGHRQGQHHARHRHGRQGPS
jgi:hypothetical protein